MIGYKAAYDYRCLNQWYEVGKTYSYGSKPILCKQGYHYCKDLLHVFSHYAMSPYTNIFEIEALGDVVSDDDIYTNTSKYATNHIKIVRELSDLEIIEKLNLIHEYDEKNRILTFEAVNGFWITKIYDKNNICIHYVDSFGYMARYVNYSGQNISVFESRDNDSKIYQYANLFKIYKTFKLFRVDHDLDNFKLTYQKQMFDMFNIKEC